MNPSGSDVTFAFAFVPKLRFAESLMMNVIWTLLPPATKLGQGNIFTGICDSVNGGRGVAGTGGCLLPGGCLLLGSVCYQEGRLVETPPWDGYCCGRYASY